MEALINILDAASGILLAIGLLAFLVVLLNRMVTARFARVDEIHAEAFRRAVEAQFRAAQASAEARFRAVHRSSEAFEAQFRAAAHTITQSWLTDWTETEAQMCAAVLIRHAKADRKLAEVLGDRKIFDATWREAARRTHPDANNGRDGKDFRAVMNARERIKTLKGWQ